MNVMTRAVAATEAERGERAAAAHLVGVTQKKARNGQMTASGASNRPEKIMHAPYPCKQPNKAARGDSAIVEIGGYQGGVRGEAATTVEIGGYQGGGG